MKTSDLQTEIFEHLHGNEAIKEFCFSEFGRVGTVQLGLDNDDYPPASTMPVIVIAPIMRIGRGDSSFTTRYVLFISVTISNDECPNTPMDNQENATNSTQGSVILTGATQVEDLRDLVEEQLFSYRKYNMKIDVSGETHTESDFPIFRSSTSVEIEIKETTNRNLVSK